MGALGFPLLVALFSQRIAGASVWTWTLAIAFAWGWFCWAWTARVCERKGSPAWVASALFLLAWFLTAGTLAWVPVLFFYALPDRSEKPRV